MTPEKKATRIAAIDMLRGFVMIIMLVDHVRGHFFSHHPIQDPLAIHDISSGLFFTRLSAHLCAPVFVLLTGISVWLYSHPKNKPPRSATAFLLKRGLFLILLEITLVNFSWSASYHTLYLQVIWAIGISMICLAFLSKLPRVWTGILGILIVFGHNLLTPITFTETELGYSLWTFLHDRGYLIPDGILKIRVSYPVLPWIGVILIGYFMGDLYHQRIAKIKRQKILVALGFSMLVLLLILRTWNIYGETLPWEAQPSVVQSVMSFLNYTKYPPSLHFLLLTLGIGCFLLAYFENLEGKIARILKIYGSAPMFFYIVHLYAILILHGVLLLCFGADHNGAFTVAHVYQLWCIAIALAIVLYFPTKKFAAYKRQSSSTLIKYF